MTAEHMDVAPLVAYADELFHAATPNHPNADQPPAERLADADRADLTIEDWWIVAGRLEDWKRAATAALRFVEGRMAGLIGSNPIRLGDTIYQARPDTGQATPRDGRDLMEWLLYEDGAQPGDVNALLPARAARVSAVDAIVRRRHAQTHDGELPDDDTVREVRGRLFTRTGTCTGCGHPYADHDVPGEADRSCVRVYRADDGTVAGACDCEAYEAPTKLEALPVSKAKTKWAAALTAHGDRRYRDDRPADGR